MGIQVEFNPDLCLRAFGTEKRLKEECLPERLNTDRIYKFLKKGQRYFWLEGEIPLRETKGEGVLSRPLASVKVLEATHYLKEGNCYTKGLYEIVEVFDVDKMNFEGYERIK